MAKVSIERLRFSNFKLRIILDVTKAINDNLPTEDLLTKFKKIISEELNIGKFLLFSKITKTWSKMLAYGVPQGDIDQIDIQKNLLPITGIEITIGEQDNTFKMFDFVLPIFKSNQVIAYVLLGDIDNEQIGLSPSLQHLQFIQTLTNIILVSIQNKELVRQSIEQERMKKELEMAAQIQAMLIPDENKIPQIDQINFRSFYMSHFEVGGDLFDYGRISKNEVYFCIADVSGKGISAAMIMSNFQANLRSQFYNTLMTLEQIVENLNVNIIKVSEGLHFVTMFLAKYNVISQKLIYVNAGHLPPIIFDYVTKKSQTLSKGCPGIGMLDDIPNIEIGNIRLQNRSKILCFTDGLSEYSTPDNDEYGYEVTKKAMLNENLDVSKTIDYVISKLNLNRNNTNIFDDITMLGVDIFPK